MVALPPPSHLIGHLRAGESIGLTLRAHGQLVLRPPPWAFSLLSIPLLCPKVSSPPKKAALPATRCPHPLRLPGEHWSLPPTADCRSLSQESRRSFGPSSGVFVRRFGPRRSRPVATPSSSPRDSPLSTPSLAVGTWLLTIFSLLSATFHSPPNHLTSLPHQQFSPTMAPTPSSKNKNSPPKSGGKKFVTPKRSLNRLVRSCSKSAMKSTEDLVVEEMKKYAFKASPLNRKILERGCISGIPAVKKRPTTVAAPFKFATEERMKLRTRSISTLSTVNAASRAGRSNSGPLKAVASARTNSKSSVHSSTSLRTKSSNRENQPSHSQSD